MPMELCPKMWWCCKVWWGKVPCCSHGGVYPCCCCCPGCPLCGCCPGTSQGQGMPVRRRTSKFRATALVLAASKCLSRKCINSYLGTAPLMSFSIPLCVSFPASSATVLQQVDSAGNQVRGDGRGTPCVTTLIRQCVSHDCYTGSRSGRDSGFCAGGVGVGP